MPVADPALVAILQNLQAGQNALQAGQNALQAGLAAIQESQVQQQQSLDIIQQELPVLRAQLFNISARHRNSVRAKAQDDVPLVPLQVSVVNASILF